jgi:membrane associated rhomboid family serine protease
MIPIKDATASKRGWPLITVLVVLANLAMFVEEVRTGTRIFNLYGVSPHDIYAYLTQGTGNILMIHRSIFVAGFVHAGYVHLCGNMLFLSVFAPAVEKELGWMRFVVFYCLAIFVAFYAHTIMYPHSQVLVVGASGAIAAVMGAYLILFPKAKIVTLVPILFLIKVVEVPSVLFMLGWFALQGANGYLSLGTPTSIAWFAHIGGFLMGVAVGVYHRIAA